MNSCTVCLVAWRRRWPNPGEQVSSHGVIAPGHADGKLTDTIAQMISHQAFHAVTFDGSRYDCGSKIGYIEANLAVALSRPDMADEMRAIAQRLR